MGKRKKSKPCDKPIVINGIKPDELKQIFIEAILESEEIKKKNEHERQEKKLQQKEKEYNDYIKKLGYIDHSTKKQPWRFFLEFGNGVKQFLKMSFRSKEEFTEFIVISSLLKLPLILLFDVLMLILFLADICIILYLVVQFFLPDIRLFSGFYNIYYLCFLPLIFSIFFIACFFRMASIEIENTDDNNLVFGVFTALATAASIIAAVVSVITIVKDQL
jgi:hypothetical protein